MIDKLHDGREGWISRGAEIRDAAHVLAGNDHQIRRGSPPRSATIFRSAATAAAMSFGMAGHLWVGARR
jgi:hypothetical protein